MTLKLEHANATAAGRFNPAILQPSWFIRHEIIEPGEPRVEIRDDGAGLRFLCSGYRWGVDASRFTVESENAGNVAIAGEFMAGTFRLLSHTPLVAVGHNFTFAGTAAASRWLAGLRDQLTAPPALSGGSLCIGQAAWNDLRDGARVQATFEPLADSKWSISVNVQRIAGTAAEGVGAAILAGPDLEWTRDFLARLTDTEVTP
jgi:hypothetical protein